MTHPSRTVRKSPRCLERLAALVWLTTAMPLLGCARTGFGAADGPGLDQPRRGERPSPATDQSPDSTRVDQSRVDQPRVDRSGGDHRAVDGRPIDARPVDAPPSAQDLKGCGDGHLPGVVLNSASKKSCNQICAERCQTCASIGLDAQGTDGRFRTYYLLDGQCYISTGSCATPMSQDSGSCYSSPGVGYPGAWTYCKCQ